MRFPVMSFNAGELSPQVDARSDVAKYKHGCRTLENMIPRIYGTAERRPGTKYIDTCGGVARVIPFIYSSTIAYIVLLEEYAMYFYYDGAQVLDADGRRLKVDTPYAGTDLFQIQYKQASDVMWLVHPDYAPMKLSRTSANAFDLTEIVFDNGPFKTRNDLAVGDGILLTPSTTASTTTEDVTDDTGCTYSARFTFSSATAASKAFDDIMTSPGGYYQSSVLAMEDQWVSCQWTGGQVISRVRIAPFAAAPLLGIAPAYWYNPRRIEIQACNDGASWQRISINGWSGNCTAWSTDGAELGKIVTPTEWADMKLDNSTAYQYWRVFVHDNYGGPFIRINEIEMIETTTHWGESSTLTASGPVFDSGHVGALFSLTQQRVNTTASGSMTYPSTGYIGDPILVEGEFTFTTHGTWSGTILLERSIDQTIWETYRTWVSSADFNVSFTGTEEETNVYYRIHVTEMLKNTASGTSSITSKVIAELTVNASTQTGICRVTAYVSAYEVQIDILSPFASTDSTARWAEGSWSDYRGYPCTVTFFEDRAVYAGSPHQTQTVWLSATGDYEDFAACTKDNSSFSLTMSSDTRCAIQWISALEALIVGTSGGEWRIRSSAYDEPLTPTNYSFKQQTTYGSTDIQALQVNDAILFVDHPARKVREAMYNGDKDKYVAADLTALAEHVTDTGIVCMAYQKNPDPILWAVRTDGTLLSMTYEREQDVIAWARHPMLAGTMETTPGEDEDDEETYDYQYYWIHTGANVIQYNVSDNQPSGGVVHYGYGAEGSLDGHRWGGPIDMHPSGSILYRIGKYAVLSAVYYWAVENQPAAPVFGAATGYVEIIPNAGWAPTALLGVYHLMTTRLSSDSKYAYVTLYYYPTTDSTVNHYYIYKIDVATNIVIWCVGGDDSNYRGTVTEADLDDDDNLWIWRTGPRLTGDLASYHGYLECYASEDGSLLESIITGYGASDPGVPYPLDLHIDEDFEYDGNTGFIFTCGTIWRGLYYNFVEWRAKEHPESCVVQVTPTVNTTLGLDRGFTCVRAYDGYVYACGSRAVYGAGYASLFCFEPDGTVVATWDCGEPPVAWASQPAQCPWVSINASGNILVADQSNDKIYELAPVTLDVVTSYTWAAPITYPSYPYGEMTLPQPPGSSDESEEDEEEATTVGIGPNSVAVIPAASEDEVWLVVGRYVGGTLYRFVEQMQPRQVDDQEDMWFVDSGLEYEGTADTTFSGLDHLEGEEVCIWADGGVVDRQTVAGGAITLTVAATHVIAGLPFRYKLKSMRFDVTGDYATTKGSLKRFAELVISFYRSLNVEYGVDTDTLFNIDWRTTEAFDAPTNVYTGDKIVVHEGGFDPEDHLILTGDDPTPCTVRCLVPRIEVTGR